MTSKERLLELAAAERAIPLKVTQAGHTYRLCHVLRPPAAADWFAYEAALEPTVEELSEEGGEPCYRLRVRSTDAALQLWERLISRVEGYSEPNGQDWRGLIPLAHKEAAVRALTDGRGADYVFVAAGSAAPSGAIVLTRRAPQ